MEDLRGFVKNGGLSAVHKVCSTEIFETSFGNNFHPGGLNSMGARPIERIQIHFPDFLEKP